MNRKEFIKNCGFTCLGLTLSSSLLESCISANYFAKNKVSTKGIELRKSEFLHVDKNKVTQRKYVLVKTDELPFPICVYKYSENDYSAVLMECTHNSCELQNQGELLQCPCHGSEFTMRGNVLNPPAEKNLKTFIINTDNDTIYIKI